MSKPEMNYENFITAPKPKRDAVIVRVPPGMRERLGCLARKKKVSVNVLCVAILKAVLDGSGA